MSMTEKLAYIKKLRHLTTEEIAQQSGVPLGTLNKIFSGQTKNPAVGPVDKITQVLRIPIHYLLDDELPIEYHVSTSTDDGILLLSSEEIQFLMKYRDLEPHSKRAVDTMTELLNMPPGRLAGNLPVKRTFCYVTAPPGDSNPLGDSFFLRPVLIPETDAAAREADFAVLLTNGSMEPLYSAGTILLCKREHASRQEYGLFLLNQEAFIRRLYYKRGITKLVAPNLNFKDISYSSSVLEPDGNRLACRIASSCAVHGFWESSRRARVSKSGRFEFQITRPTVRISRSTAFQFVPYCFATSG